MSRSLASPSPEDPLPRPTDRRLVNRVAAVALVAVSSLALQPSPGTAERAAPRAIGDVDIEPITLNASKSNDQLAPAGEAAPAVGSGFIGINRGIQDRPTVVRFLSPIKKPRQEAVPAENAPAPEQQADDVARQEVPATTLPPEVPYPDTPVYDPEPEPEPEATLPEEPDPAEAPLPPQELMPKIVNSAQEAIDRFEEPGQFVIEGYVAMPGGKEARTWYKNPVLLLYEDGETPILAYTMTGPDGKQTTQAAIGAASFSVLQIFGTEPGAVAKLAQTEPGDVECVPSTTGLDQGECRVGDLVYGQRLIQEPAAIGANTEFRLLNKGSWQLTPASPDGQKG